MTITPPGRCLGLAVLALALAGAAAQAKVGITSTTAGDPIGKPPTLQERVLRVGTDVFANEAIRTTANDRAHLLFNDGTALTIGPNAQITIDRYIYDPDKGTGDMAVTATRGVFRLVGGKISKSNEVQIKTPAATLGIRGGIVAWTVSADKTQAYFLFGKSLTVVNDKGKQVLTRPDSKVETTLGNPPGPALKATPAETAEVTGATEAPATTSGPATGTPLPGVSRAELADAQPPSTPTPPPSTASPQITTQLVQVTNETTSVIDKSNQPFTQPSETVSAEGRYLSRPEFAPTSGARNPANNTTLSSATVTGGSSVTITTSNQLSFTFPWEPNSVPLLSGSNTSSTLGPVSGWGLVSQAGDAYAYVFAPNSDSTKVSRVFGGTLTATSALPTSGYGAHVLVSLDSPATISPTVFVSPTLAALPAVQGAFNSPLLSAYSPNAHAGAIAGSPDPNQRAVALQASLGIVGQGAAQSSYVGLMIGTYITDYTKPDAMALAGSYQGSLRASAGDRVIRLNAGASTMETQSGTAIYGPAGDFMVIGPDGFATTGPNASGRSPSFAAAVPHDVLASPIERYYPLALAVQTAAPAGLGSQRTTQTLNGFAAANVETRDVNAGVFTESSMRNLSPLDLSLSTSASSNRAQATFKVAASDDPMRDLTVQLGSLNGLHASASAFVDDANFALIQNPQVGTTYNGLNPASGRLFAVTQSTVPATGLLPPGVSFCSCEYLSWGYWAGEVSYASGPRAGQTDRMHLGTWVAGQLSVVQQLPTAGTATYSGHVIGNVTNGSSRYIAAGGFQHNWNFATRSGAVSITSFDGTNYAGASSGPAGSVNFSANIAGGGRSGAMNGAFFRSPADPAKYQAGSFGITGPNYRATGIFAGQR